MSVLPVVDEDKENISCTLRKETKARPTLKPRRGSIAVRPNPPASSQVLQPKRRASIATIRPESNTNLATPLRSSIRSRNDRAVGRQSFVWDPQRVWRTSRVSSPLPQSRELSSATIEATPVGQRSSKFKVSPPSQAGSWRPKHPTVVALHKKHLVWSPLKMRGMKSNNWKS
ncbi:UNVERIFIED_CONTAM: Kinesin-like protein KIN-14S [Sesamum calycinum]|uniref:Kinesin-like protein KIN-14S n=1 Tax=Sesamum calycinum TaxID=2727403 RepID=A0AAW2PQG7_9LAMI